MNEMMHENRLVKVMCIEPNGIWAMVRVKADYATMPFVVRVKELSEPGLDAYGSTDEKPPLCRWCDKPEAEHTTTTRHKFLATPKRKP